MPLTIRSLSPQAGVTPETSAALSDMAREVLQDLSDDVVVSFSAWDDGAGPLYVCRVETAPGDPLGDQPPWRFWSGLFADADEMRAELERGLAHRLAPRAPEIGASAGVSAAAEATP